MAASHPLCARLTPTPLSLPAPVPVPLWLPGAAPERPPGVALWSLRGCRQPGVAVQVVCGLSIMAGYFPAPFGRIWALPALGGQRFSFGCPLLCEGPRLCVPGLMCQPLASVSAGLAPSVALRPLRGNREASQSRRGCKESPARFESFPNHHMLFKVFPSFLRKGWPAIAIDSQPRALQSYTGLRCLFAPLRRLNSSDIYKFVSLKRASSR